MSRELIETGLGWSWTPVRVGRNIRDRETLSIVACAGDKVIGFAICQFASQHAHLSLLAVRQDYQRVGVGRQLVRWIEESALTAGITAMQLEVRAANEGARRFYRCLGFSEVALMPFYYRGKEAGVRLSRGIGRSTTSSLK